jgi:hypothetical protein
MVLGIPTIPTMSSLQLYQTAESDVNILGLIAIVGNSKCMLDNGRGYSNYMRITIPLTFPTDYEKIELAFVPDFPHLLQLSYPAIPQAITNDFAMIEAQMEAKVCDSNKDNAGFISNLQGRIIEKESVLAEKELLIKSKILFLPVDPTTRKPYTCNNYNWQGSTHDDTDVKETYLCPYKNVISINATVIEEGGGVNDGITPVNCGC